MLLIILVLTQRPHEHLFQKLGVWVILWCINCDQARIDIFVFFSLWLQPITLLDGLYGSILFTIHVIRHIGITRRPYDHLFQKLGVWMILWCINCYQAKIDIFVFFSLWLQPNTLLDGLYGSICSQHMLFIILILHRGLMTIYFKSRASGCYLGA